MSSMRKFAAWTAVISVFTLSEISFSQTVNRGPYLQTGTATSIVVRWRTTQATDSRVRYGTTLGNLNLTADDPASTTEHIVKLTGLSPETKYFYSIGTSSASQAGGDANYYFITSPTPGTSKPTRIWALGDAGTKNDDQRAVRDAYYNFTGDRHTDLWMMLGDNAYNNGEDSEYQLAIFENMYESMLQKSVLWATRGNHDRGPNSGGGWTNGGAYYDMMTLPANGEAGGMASGTEAYYSFDYGNIHFICLESTSNELRSANSQMWTWLEADLAANDKNWTIAFWHHPPYSKGSHNSDSESELVDMRELALPLLEDSGLDLVLSGHSHSYERSYFIDGHYGNSSTFNASMEVDGGNGRTDGTGAYTKASLTPMSHAGAVYIVAGSSGKVSGGSLDHPVMFSSLNELGSMVLDIDGNRLDAKFLDDAGTVRDYFTILKQGGVVGPATQLVMASGNNQTGQVGAALANPFVVEARGANNNPVPGVSVTFAINSGGGSLSNSQSQLTGANGRASVTLTLGTTPGGNTVTAASAGLGGSPLLFAATGTQAPVNMPAIATFTPMSGVAGTQVTVTGANFSSLTNVSFNGMTASTYFVDANTQVRVNVPSGATSGKISIATTAGTGMSANNFTVNSSNPGTPGNVTVNPKLGPMKPGSNADDPAIWIHPTDPNRSLFFLSDKDAGIYVFSVTGAQLQHIDFGTALNNIDVRKGFALGGQTIDIVSGNLRDVGKLAVLKINPDYNCSSTNNCSAPPVSVLADRNSSNNTISSNSYGFTLYRRPSDGAMFVFEKPASNAPIKQYLIDGSSGQIVVTLARTINDVAMGQSEGFVADDELGYVYFAEEAKGIHKYNADPSSSQLTRLSFFASGDGTASDREGLCLYSCSDGSGYLVLSSQGNSTFKVYERQGGNLFVKTFIAAQSDGTDGLDICSASIPGFPNGFIIIHDDPGMQYYVYDWADVAELDLTVCPDGGANTKVATPQISPNGGVFAGSVQVSLSTATSGAEIHYTLDGSTPGLGSTLYAAPLTLSSSATVSARAFLSGLTDSNVATAVFTIGNVGSLPTISSFAPPSGAVGAQVTIAGNNFVGVTGVAFNGAPASGFIVDSATQLRVAVPAGATSGKISVTTAAGTAISNTDFIVGASSGGTVMFNPIDDAYVRSTDASDNFGGESELRVRSSSSLETVTYLKFNVNGLAGPAQNAKVRMYVMDGGNDGGSIYTTSNNYLTASTEWEELSLNWTNAPAGIGSALNTTTTATNGTWVEFDVTSAIAGNGVFSFMIKNTSDDRISFGAKESNNDPQLVIQTSGQSSALAVTSFSPAAGMSGTEVTINGVNFTGATQVAFAGASANTFVVDSDTQIRAIVPSNATTGKISVTSSLGTAFSLTDFAVQTTGVDDRSSGAVPRDFQTVCYPNPFNGVITIEYTLPQSGNVRVVVYNSLGQKVRTLVDGIESSGSKRVQWDGANDASVHLGSGVYFYQIEFGAQRLTGRMILQQ